MTSTLSLSLLSFLSLLALPPPQVIAKEVVGGATHNGTTQVRVYVKNENDNTPEFEMSEYSVTIPESANSGSFIQRVM